MANWIRLSTFLSVASISISGCNQYVQSPADQAHLAVSVQRIQGGGLIDRLNSVAPSFASAEDRLLTDLPGPELPKSETPDPEAPTPEAVSPEGSEPEPTNMGEVRDIARKLSLQAQVEDPCPTIAKPKAGAPKEEMEAALEGLATCFTGLYKEPAIFDETLSVLKLVRPTLPPGSLPLRERSVEELTEFVKANEPIINGMATGLGLNNPNSSVMRISYSDEDLEEIVGLARRWTRFSREAEKKVFAAVNERMDLFKYFAEERKIDRYVALLVLKDTATDPFGRLTANTLHKALKPFGYDFEIPQEMLTTPGILGLGFIHPFALSAVLPDEGKATEPLHRVMENPYHRVRRALAHLAGPDALIENTRYTYRLKRDLVSPPLPVHPAAAPDAIRVAFLDSAIDFQTEPDLGEFLGDGTQGQLSSIDLGGARGNNPWGPIAIPMFTHGSGTAASFLTVLAQEAPEILEKRKLDLAMWKFSQDEELLKGPMANETGLTPGLVANDQLFKKIEMNEVKPKLLSVSMKFHLWKSLKKTGKLDLVKNAPWLWIMAAGNDGQEVKDMGEERGENPPSCLRDFPTEHRNDANILCVGALVQGITHPKIAEYSNYGDRVDVYAFESYTKFCPNGTSCSTPAVTAAAAIIAEKFPSLTPAQLKEVIVEASEWKELEVGLTNGASDAARLSPRLHTKMKVRVFNPVAMLPQALKVAAAKVATSH